MSTPKELGLTEGIRATLTTGAGIEFWKREQSLHTETVMTAKNHGISAQYFGQIQPDTTPANLIQCVCVKPIYEGERFLYNQYVVSRVLPDGSLSKQPAYIKGNENVLQKLVASSK